MSRGPYPGWSLVEDGYLDEPEPVVPEPPRRVSRETHWWGWWFPGFLVGFAVGLLFTLQMEGYLL